MSTSQGNLTLAGASAYRRSLRRHGRTFHWASRLFGRELSGDIALLYAFCRYLDDLADEMDSEQARERLAVVERDIRAGRSAMPVVRDFLRLAERVDIPIEAVQALLSTLRRDVGPIWIDRWEQTLRYSYGVASTVGLMFCAIVGVKNHQALPHAIDLGIAMQLTNMARDVLEDAAKDRVYLPITCTTRDEMPAAILAGDLHARAAALGAVHTALTLAERYYRSADAGICYLPWRARLAVIVASRCYEAIGRVIERRRQDYWAGRCYVGTIGKVWHTLRALMTVVVDRRYRRLERRDFHEAALHGPLRGLPGTNPWAA